MAASVQKMLPFLRCPRSGQRLKIVGDQLCSEGGEQYPIINGKPVLVRRIRDFHLNSPPAAHISKNIAEYILPLHLARDAICLHLGSGDVPSSDPRVISIDILPTESTDLVAEAEALPFATNCIDYVESGAVFEHVFSPIDSIKEVRRILKENGEIFIDTAFMQGYHGFPSHYFNMTPQAVETFLCDGFVLEESYVPDGAMVTHSLATQINRFLELLPPPKRRALEGESLASFLNVLREQTTRHSSLTETISEYGHRSLAASFAIRARKPRGYVEDAKGHVGASERAEYYACRLEVLHRHHEIEMYRRLCLDNRKETTEYELPTIKHILDYAQSSIAGDGDYNKAIDSLKNWEVNLRTMRDETIRMYLRDQ